MIIFNKSLRGRLQAGTPWVPLWTNVHIHIIHLLKPVSSISKKQCRSFKVLGFGLQ